MIRVSANTEYGYLALLKLAQDSDRAENTKLKEIINEKELSEKFMLQVLTELRRAGLIESRRGKNGGYTLARAAGAITIGDLLRVTAGRSVDPGGACQVVDKNSFFARWLRSTVSELNRIATSVSFKDVLEEESDPEPIMYYI